MPEIVKCPTCKEEWIASEGMDAIESLRAHIDLFHPGLFGDENEEDEGPREQFHMEDWI